MFRDKVQKKEHNSSEARVVRTEILYFSTKKKTKQAAVNPKQLNYLLV